MKITNPKVNAYMTNEKKWRKESEELRRILLDSPLTEDFKWKHPAYTYESNNVVLIQGFKDYCALFFIKGSLLKDAKGILVQLTENMQVNRQIRFTGLQQILEMEPTIRDYINEAIEVEKSGVKVEFKKTAEFKMPEEFKTKLDEDPILKKAFESLTPGRQHAYLLYFSAPKQSATRESRVEKYMSLILNGKGLND
jgi:uncharacterized protein YdeI (YjbR/CyaY-like superfamily)